MMYKIRQQYTVSTIDDPARATLNELKRLNMPVKPGQAICIAVGSRGIDSIDRITRAVVDFVTSCRARPFIIPAMGSHGGATPEGQREVLAGYGITGKSMDAPIDASMDVEELAGGAEYRLFISRAANRADGTILINRIKPHTDYHGTYESGLVKMSVIGLGKHAQALEIHRFGVRGLKELLPRAARRIFSTGKVLAGVAIVENALDKPTRIEAVPVEAVMEREPALLAMARDNMARLPVDEIDLLIVDYIGKDFSGTGLDTNIIGRMRIRGEPEPQRPSIKSIVVRDISERSHGNALGIGLADVITRRLYDKIDYAGMYENATTSTFFERVKVPMVAETDAEALHRALRCCGPVVSGEERVVRIRNTLHLDHMYVSEAIRRELESRETITVVSGPQPLCEGNEFPEF
ncbi:MAG: hypothetical protein JW913_13920 [Chitinispirillaceae bacterium]|nr:hypothetical protein [Chitinispirillaceae bacterium]